MKPLGSVLMITGVLIGFAVGIGMLAGVSIPGVSWFIAVGLVKLTLFAAVGFIGVGATLHRLAARADSRRELLLSRPNEELKPPAAPTSLVE